MRKLAVPLLVLTACGSRCCASPQSDGCSLHGAAQPCDPTGKLIPVDERFHSDSWVAIIGGQVYRGSCYPDLVGTYIYSDNMFSRLATAKLQPNGTIVRADLPGTFPSGPASIHADARGELYESDVRGGIWHIEASQ
jgi:hypothetical protein